LFAAEGQEKGPPVSKIVQASDYGPISTIAALRGNIHKYERQTVPSRDLMDHFLMFDCQRPIVGSHFSVTLPGYRIGRFFCFLLERARTLGNFLCVCHLTPHAEQGFP
jgi:hypothetical protein